MIEEMVDDAMSSALDTEDVEEETEQQARTGYALLWPLPRLRLPAQSTRCLNSILL